MAETMNTLLNSLLKYIVPAVVVVGCAWAVAWYMKPDPVPPGIHVEATTAKEVKDEPKIEIVTPLWVHKPAVKKKLNLPTPVVEDPNAHVIGSVTTKPDERPHTITTVVDTKTGNTTTYDRTEPLPWITVNTRSEVGVFYGIKGGDPVLRLQARQEFLQVKALHFGAVGSFDSDGHYFVGAGAWARF